MASYSAIQTRILQLLSNHPMISSSDVQTLIQTDHQEILESYSWSRRKADTIISLNATYTTGTVSTSGSTLTGSGTTFTSGMVGRFVRVGDHTYFLRLTGFTSTTSMTMETSLSSDAAAGTSYTIFQHRYNLPSDFGRVLNVTSDVRMIEVSRNDLDRIDPYRSSTATRPDTYSIYGLDPETTSSQRFQIEVWPVPSSAGRIRVEYLQNDALSAGTDEPLYRSDLLVWKSAESGALMLLGKTGDSAWATLADRFHARYLEAFENARLDDLGRFSAVSHVRDSYYDNTRSDDFWLDHDGLGLR